MVTTTKSENTEQAQNKLNKQTTILDFQNCRNFSKEQVKGAMFKRIVGQGGGGRNDCWQLWSH